MLYLMSFVSLCFFILLMNESRRFKQAAFFVMAMVALGLEWLP